VKSDELVEESGKAGPRDKLSKARAPKEAEAPRRRPGGGGGGKRPSSHAGE